MGQLTYEQASKLVAETVEKLEKQQSDNKFKYAYITGYLMSELEMALSGDAELVIHRLKSL